MVSRLTRVPIALIDPGPGEDGDVATKAGVALELQDPGTQSDSPLRSGQYDLETGTLQLTREDRSTIIIRGFLTKSNMGIGPTGPTGPQGKPGTNGRNGRDGRTGDQGCVGPKGDPGPIGPTGPAGQSGGVGTQGATGPTGPIGPTGPAGLDGEKPIFGVGENNAYESFKDSSLKMWGHFKSDEAALFQRLVFPSAFLRDKPRIMLLHFLDPASPIKNAVRVDRINKGNAELSVVVNLLEQVPDGEGGTTPVEATGWDFYWFIIGSDANA